MLHARVGVDEEPEELVKAIILIMAAGAVAKPQFRLPEFNDRLDEPEEGVVVSYNFPSPIPTRSTNVTGRRKSTTPTASRRPTRAAPNERRVPPATEMPE